MNEEVMVGGHISRQFDLELDEIRSRVLKMGGLVEAQLDKALESLREGDAEAIVDVEKLDRKVNALEMQIDEECTKNIRKDQDIDEEYSRVVVRLVNYMKKDPDNISDALDVMWAARSLERIGDHCINICENVIYLVEGQDVRHSKLEDIHQQLS